MRNVNQKADQLQRVIEKLTRMLAQKNITVTQRGVQACCEFDQRTGKVKRINLPVIPPKPTEAFINALHGYLDHEVAHALFTDPKQEKRVAESSDLKLSPDQRHSMVNIVDDVRIENLMAEEFRGSIDNLEATRIFVQDTIWGPELAKLDFSNPVDAQMGRTIGLVPYLRALGGHRACQLFVDQYKLAPLFAELIQKMPDLERRLLGLRTSTEVAKLADDLLHVMRPPPPPEPPKQPPPPPQPKQEPQDKDEDKEDDDSEGDGEGEGGAPPPEDDEDSEGDDKEQDGEGAGGGEDETDSDKHEADKDAPEDDTPDDHETEGKDQGGEEQDDTDREGAGGGEPDEDDEDGGEGDNDAGSDSDDDGDDEGQGSGSDDESDDQDADADEDADDEGDSHGGPGVENDGEDDADDTDSDSGGDQDAGDQKFDANPAQQDHEGQGGSLNEGEEEPAKPMEIDLDGLKDMDEALAAAMQGEMAGAFDGGVQTDFSRDFDVIEPYPSEGITDTSEIEDLVKKLTGPMQKELQRIMVARSQSFNVGGYRSGRLNGPALHRVMAGDDRCFKRKVEAPSNEVAVSLVCDISGSMSGSKMQMAMISAWAFAAVLDKLKIPHEVLGFTTTNFSRSGLSSHQQRKLGSELEQMYRDTGLPRGSIRFTPVYIPIFKGFNEGFGVEQKKRMTRMVKTQQGMGSNNDAAALQIASERLLRRPERRKIMIVFSDGQPTCGSVHPYIIGETMRKIITRIQKQGVETVGVGILDSTVKAFYPRSMVLDDIMNLPKLVMKELKALLVGRTSPAHSQ